MKVPISVIALRTAVWYVLVFDQVWSVSTPFVGQCEAGATPTYPDPSRRCTALTPKWRRNDGDGSGTTLVYVHAYADLPWGTTLASRRPTRTPYHHLDLCMWRHPAPLPTADRPSRCAVAAVAIETRNPHLRPPS